MTRDPFDELRRRNPHPEERAPTPPMVMADRIMERRSTVRRGWVVAVASAALVIVVGGGSILLFRGDTETTGIAATNSTEVADSTVPTESPATTAAPDGTPPTTSATVPASEVAEWIVVYFIIDDPTATGSTQSLIPVGRPSPAVLKEPGERVGRAVEALLTGPTSSEAEARPMISSAIPVDTRLLGVEVSDRVATVDLSEPFGSGTGSFGEIARLEQLLYTVTRVDGIDGLRLRIDGEPIAVFGSHGLVLGDPEARDDLDTLLPAILIEQPPFTLDPRPVAGERSHPLTASGTANVFEATISYAVTDADGLIIAEGFTTATCGTGCRGEWDLSIPYRVDVAQRGALIVWEESARDGSQQNVREHPVWLTPVDDGTASAGDVGSECSGGQVVGGLIDQPGLPAVVAQRRSSVFTAATSCDWEMLAAAMAEPFSFSFGPPGDAIESWRSLEADGYEPMRFLAELLNRPYAVQDLGKLTYYWWPSAFPVPWDEVPTEDREALRPLFGDDDFVAFESFGGYFGYRVGITDAGEWVVFVAGD